MILAYVLALYFQKIISTPILNLAAIAKEISEKGNLKRNLRSEGTDEISQLYNSFDNMLKQILSKEQETQFTNTILVVGLCNNINGYRYFIRQGKYRNWIIDIGSGYCSQTNSFQTNYYFWNILTYWCFDLHI